MLTSNFLPKTLRAAMAGAMVFVWYLGPAISASAATDEERALAFSAQIQASMLALEDGDRDAPRDRWDPQYVVDTVGIESDDLTRWVRESVVWMPYRGTLRGAEGVLMDRVGNSLDQSLLLARLLRLAGHDVRLAHAKLSGPAVDALWDRLRANRSAADDAEVPASVVDGQQAGADSPEPQGSEVLVTADLYGIDRTSVAEVIDTASAEAVGLSADISARIGDQTARLAAIVGPLDGTALADETVAGARESLADHWWVQVRQNDVWVDLDLMSAPGAPALAPAAENHDPASLPAELEQRVVIRVIAEQFKDNQLKQHVILEQSARPRDLVGTTLGFRHFPMAWPENWPQVTPDDIQIKLRAALSAQTEWLPVLVLGETVIGTVGVYDTGELDPAPHPVNPFMQMTVAMMGAISKATDVLATGGDPDAMLPADPTLATPRPPRVEGELVAEWLEYEIQIPGSEPVTARRELFDLIGPAARASGDVSGFTMSGEKSLTRSMSMLSESEIQILGSRLAPEFLTHLGALNAIGNRPVLDELARDPFGKLPSNFMELFAKLNGMPAALHTLAAVRFDLNPWSDWVYVDRPSIVAQHTKLRRAGGGDFVAGVGLDIVENGVGVDPMAAESAALLRMSQGIADTHAETVALSKVGNVAANAAVSFSAIAVGEADWRILRPGDQQLLAPLGYEADIAARIAEELANGWFVIVPPRAEEGKDLVGWWRIDPKTGATLGIGRSGHGQAMVEYALIIIIQTMMAAAQCALQASIIRAAEKTLAEKAKGADSGKATAAGAKAGYEQAKSDWTKNRNLCIASGLAAGFNAMLVGFAMQAVRTSGSRGYDGSKRTPPRAPGETASRAAPGTAPPAPAVPRAPNLPSRTPTKPGVGPQGQPRAPTLPSRTPTEPGLGPKQQPATTAKTGTQPSSPKSGRTPQTADTQPALPTPRDRFMDAQRRAQEAQDRMVKHKPVDTPEGRDATDKLWKDLDAANRDRILAYNSMPRNQRPAAIPPVPPPPGAQPPIGGDFTGYKTGEGPPSKMPPTQPAPGADFGGYKTGEGPPSQIPPTQAAPGQGRATKTGEAPASSIPDIKPGTVPPAPTTGELLAGLGKRDVSTPARPGKPTGSTPSPDSLLGGLDGSLPPPAAPVGGRNLSAPSGPEASKAAGLAGIAGALGSVAQP